MRAVVEVCINDTESVSILHPNFSIPGFALKDTIKPVGPFGTMSHKPGQPWKV